MRRKVTKNRSAVGGRGVMVDRRDGGKCKLGKKCIFAKRGSLCRVVGVGVTMPPCHHVTMPPCHHVTMSPCHRATMPPCHHAAMPPCHHATMPPCHHATMPPSHHPTMPPCHHATLNARVAGCRGPAHDAPHYLARARCHPAPRRCQDLRVRADMCIDMCIDVRVDMCVDVWVDMRVDMCV